MLDRLLGWLRATASFLLSHPASLVVVLVALIGGAAAGVPVGDGMYTYMWQDPRFCNDCHVHDYANEAWAASVHGQLTTCHDCHRVPIRHYPKNLVYAAFWRPQVPEDIPKPHPTVEICEQCHSSTGGDEPLTGPMAPEVRAEVVKIDHSPLHRLHLDSDHRTPSAYEGGQTDQGEGPIECLDCHGGENLTAHQFPARTEHCERCHEGVRPEDEHGGGLQCLDCHAAGFLGARENGEAPAEGK